jgi:dynein heavy chain 2
VEIKEALAASSELQHKLNTEREVYRDFARTGSNVYFLIQSLKSLNYMYQFDLPTYLGLFKKTLQTSMSAGDVEDRMRIIELDLKRNVFQFVARSLFKSDRLTFATHLVRGIRPETVGEEEWKFFIGLVIADSTKSVNVPEWVPPDRVAAVQRLCATMPMLVQQLRLEDESMWRDWLASPKPEDRTQFPSRAGNITEFQRILAVQALRPDRVQTAMDSFSCVQLGVKSLNLQGLDFKQLCNESSPRTPIMFIITPGADPSAVLEDAANKVLGAGRYQQLAMGQGQSEAALRMLNEGAEKGLWVCLQNVHLVVGWLGVIEKTLHSLEPDDNFRLWLTTEPHPRFPPILLQQSLKVTFEAPPGLKMNLQNAYDMWDEEYITRKTAGGTARAQLLFIVAWFHAVVQERRTFIPQGWSKFHEFSYADLRSTADIITAIQK